MSIRSVEISGAAEAPYKIDLIRPGLEELYIKGDIDGLGAGKADLFISERASMDGNTFNGARFGSRNITFTVGFGDRLDPEFGREICYDILPIKEEVTLLFESERKTVMIKGYVESNDPSIFTKDPANDISIVCVENPYFQSLPNDKVSIKLYSLENVFEFPFSNESISMNMLEMGKINVDRYAEVRYPGSIPIGLTIRLRFTGPATTPRITSDRTGQTMMIDSTKVTRVTGMGLTYGDVVEINTVRGQKSVTLERLGVKHNIISALDVSSQWIEIRRGLNPISVNAQANLQNIQVELLYDMLYSGL